MKTKYEAGDKVRVRADLTSGCKYSMLDGGCSLIVMDDMVSFVGKEVTIKQSLGKRGYLIKEDDYRFCWTDEMFERFIQPIIIYAKGNEVIALDKNTGENGVAKCSPDDTFDFRIGAELALNRLCSQKKTPPKFKVGDIVVGLPEADTRYSITKSGWTGLVVEVTENAINVEGVNDIGQIIKFNLDPNYFRKISG